MLSSTFGTIICHSLYQSNGFIHWQMNLSPMSNSKTPTVDT